MDDEIELPEPFVRLDGFAVAAHPGKGVYIVDSTGHCWLVAGTPNGQADDNKLAQAYREATK